MAAVSMWSGAVIDHSVDLGLVVALRTGGSCGFDMYRCNGRVDFGAALDSVLDVGNVFAGLRLLLDVLHVHVHVHIFLRRPLMRFQLGQFTFQSIIPPLVVAYLPDSILAISRIEPSNKSWNQMRMLGCFPHSRKPRTGRLSLARCR